MEDVKILTISELVRRARPHTAASSLRLPPSRPTSPSTSRSNPTPQPQPPPGPSSSNPNPNPQILTPLDHPAILFGTLTLPAQTLKCSNSNCFQFSDDSSTICCDILNFDVRMIGKKIHVFAWNFIPLKHCGGFLEIIKWSFPDSSCGISRCSSVDSFALISGFSSASEHNSKSHYRVHGAMESLSPISVVPCSTKSQGDKGTGTSFSSNLRGFLVRIMVCECKLCSSKESINVLHNAIRARDSHSFTKPVFVYFCGSASFWHPVITKLVGNIVTLSGLKKKLIFIGKEESQLMFVSAENSVLHLPRLSKKWLPYAKTVIKGKGECGAYTGIVKGVYMQGMVVELDKEVWLLLTDQLLNPPHSLRVGAVISVRNVHFVNPKFSWTKILILGACFKTSITIESFSPLETACHLVSQSGSLLGKFIASLAFSARLWALLLVSCFRKKFAGILSEKEILGTKHKEGLAQMYASSRLPSSVFRARVGVFMEVSNHESCGCGSEPYCGNLKLLVPISSFVQQCEATWIGTLTQSKRYCNMLRDNNQLSYLPCEGRSCGRLMRRIFPSEDIGIVLVGSVKITPSSGRLQLVDVTGSIDLIIPDLPSTLNGNSIYEVIDYSLIMEGIPELVDHLGLLENKLFSCRNIFHNAKLARELNLTICVYFHLRNAKCRNLPIYPTMDWKDDFKELESGTFHLFRITHKYPVLHKFQGDPLVSNCSSMFVEAIVLPWDLFLARKDETMHPTKVSKDELNKPMEHCDGGNYQEDGCRKRNKSNHASSRASRSGFIDYFSDAGNELSACSSSYRETSEERRCGNLSSSHKIPCLATVRSVDNQRLVSSGILYFTKANVKFDVDCKSNLEKALLEFKSDSFFKYQLLQIGGYYMTKHHSEDSFCKINNSDYVNCLKVLITSRTHLWSLSFSSREVLPNDNSLDFPPLDSFFSNNEVLARENIELLLQRSTCNSPGTSCSDVSLHLSADVIGHFKVNLKELDERLIKQAGTPEETSIVSPCIWTTMPVSTQSSGSPDSNWLFPEGNLISLHGIVVAIHGFDYSSSDVHLNSQSLGDVLQLRFFQGVTSNFCIHLLVHHQTVRIFGSLSKHAYPLGLGPGVTATFHRILELGEPNRLMLTPVSYIVINSIRVVDEPHSDKSSNLCSASDKYNDAFLDNVSSCLISELYQCLDGKLMQFRCRIVAVHVLVLEKKKRKYDDLQSGLYLRPHLVDIPLAGFVLDDGASSCCCWANTERAATLLRLHEELPQRAFESSGWTLKWVGIDNKAQRTMIYHIERILKKHDRIIVKNYGSIFDSSYQDLTVSVSSDNALSSSDENLLKFMIFNACFGTVWTVVASLMDSNAVGRLEKEHLVEMEMPVHSMQNIWAQEACCSNLLSEARNICQELLTANCS